MKLMQVSVLSFFFIIYMALYRFICLREQVV